jgi:hypothetical protein
MAKRRKALKSLDFQCFFGFTHLPVLRKILKRRVCKKALRQIGV